MKQLIRDILLLGLCFYIVVQTLYDYGQDHQLLDLEIQEFEASIERQEQVVVYYDNPSEDNNASLLVKTISDLCIEIIETLLIIVSNLIHILL